MSSDGPEEPDGPVEPAGSAQSDSLGKDLHVVVPEWIDDSRRPSGGNVYDRRICDGLATLGWSVHEHSVSARWPPDGPPEDPFVAEAPVGLPQGSLVLVDGLVAPAVAEVSTRLRLVVLQHMIGADPTEPSSLGASAFVATSDSTKRWLVDDCAVAADSVHVVLPGVEPAPLARGSESGSRLLGVGALTPVKGQDVLVEALARIQDQGWRCVLAGSAEVDLEFVADVRRRIDEFVLGDRISMPGVLSRARLDAAYGQADVLVLPSRAEGYGMVVTEALARGIPVIAADVGGVREAIGRAPDGRLPGVLVPAEDPPALARAIRSWLADPGLRERLRSAARARRRTLGDWAHAAAAMAAALDTVVGRSE